MSTANTWQEFYKKHKGVYSSGHFTDRTDTDGQIANAYHIAYREAILQNAGADKVALELGCGNQPIFDVLGSFGGIWYTDISKEALVEAEKNFLALDLNESVKTTVHFKEMDVRRFTFDDHSLDVVFNTRAPHEDATSIELFRTLKTSGAYIYQTIGEQDFKDFKILFKGGRFYNDYLQKSLTRFGVLKESLIKSGFKIENISLIFDKTFKSYFESKQALKEKLWLLVGDYDFDLAENDLVLDQYIESHRDKEGRIYVENHRIIVQAIK